MSDLALREINAKFTVILDKNSSDPTGREFWVKAEIYHV